MVSTFILDLFIVDMSKKYLLNSILKINFVSLENKEDKLIKREQLTHVQLFSHDKHSSYFDCELCYHPEHSFYFYRAGLQRLFYSIFLSC